MQKISSRRSKNSKGSALVESALIFVAFFCTMIGIFDFGQFLYIHQALVDRARWAGRAGYAGPGDGTTYTDAQIMNLVVYGSATAGTGSGYFGLTEGTVSNGACSGGMVCAQDYDSDSPSYRTELRIYSYPYTILSPYIAGRYNGPNITVEIPRGQYN